MPALPTALLRLCRRGSTKMPQHLLPSLRQAVAEDRPRTMLTLAVAAWFCYLRGADLRGRPIVVEDARADLLRRLAIAGGRDPRALVQERSVFGDLGCYPSFVAELAQAIEQLERDGVRATLAAHLTGTASLQP